MQSNRFGQKPQHPFVRIPYEWPFDYERNKAIYDQMLAKRKEYTKILQGDWLKGSNDVFLRVAHVWPDRVVQPADTGGGSHCIGPNGGSSMSGSLQAGVSLDKITPTEEFKDAYFWFFLNNSSGAHRGVDCIIPVRVWAYDGALTLKEYY